MKLATENLHPAYFAMVMATGIVSIAADLMEMRPIAAALCWLNVLFFVALWLLTLDRILRHRKRFLADLVDHGRGPGFFTLVAGTCILGSQWLIIYDAARIAEVLWFFSIALWLVLTYSIFTGITIKENKPTLAEGMHGGWLIAVVATQAVSVLGARLAPRFAASDAVVFFSLTILFFLLRVHLD